MSKPIPDKKKICNADKDQNPPYNLYRTAFNPI